MATMELEGRLAACSAQAEQSRLLAHRLQAAWLGLANLTSPDPNLTLTPTPDPTPKPEPKPRGRWRQDDSDSDEDEGGPWDAWPRDAQVRLRVQVRARVRVGREGLG